MIPDSPLPAPCSQPESPNRVATISAYLDMRDELWKELVDKRTDQLDERSLGLLELGNKVCRTLLTEASKTHGPTLWRALELLRCNLCDTWISRARYELRGFQRQSPNPAPSDDREFIRKSLELAAGPEPIRISQSAIRDSSK